MFVTSHANRWLSLADLIITSITSSLLLFSSRFPQAVSVALVSLVGIWLLRWKLEKYPLPPTPLNLALLGMLITIPIAVLVSVDIDLTKIALSYLLAGVVLFFSLSRWSLTRRRVMWIWGGMVFIGLLLVILAPFGMELDSSNALFHIPKAYTAFSARMPKVINPNVLAGALVILFPIALSPPLPKGRTRRMWGIRVLSWLSAVLMIVTIILTKSRGAYLGVIAELALLLIMRWPKAALIVVPLIAVLFLVLVHAVGWNTLLNELMKGSVTSGLEQRIEIWSRAIYAIQDFPFTGIGLGTFERVVAVLYPLFLNPASTVPHAHNLFLQVAVDLGIPGLIAYLSVLGLALLMAFSLYYRLRLSGDCALSSLCAGCFVALVGMCVHGLVDAVAWVSKPAFVSWMVIGLVVGLYRIAHSSELTPSPAR